MTILLEFVGGSIKPKVRFIKNCIAIFDTLFSLVLKEKVWKRRLVCGGHLEVESVKFAFILTGD